MAQLVPLPADSLPTNCANVYVAVELSRSNWIVAVHAPALGDKVSSHQLAGGDVAHLLSVIDRVCRQVAHTGHAEPIAYCCYEAGYDGFWLHRLLLAHGIRNFVLDAASLLVDRRAKRAKTDHLDARSLLRALIGLSQGDTYGCRAVRVPTVDEEDARRLHRERQRLVRERTGHINRIKALLSAQGIRALRITDKTWLNRLGRLRTGDGRPLPAQLRAEIARQWRRLMLLEEMRRQVEAERDGLLRGNTGADQSVGNIQRLAKLKGIGPEFATIFAREVFYRHFSNRRQVGSYLGLAPCPYNSGSSRRDQGISKAGNPRARTAAIEMAWMWLRYQPNSALSQWYRNRVGTMEGRIRRILIVGLARKLVIALWRYVSTGLVPTGAIIET
ncbi:IS110 family transposase [Bradyrhizobium sp. Gha]|uniref:IS110 family transposase n=1 Tax=Bradyrhizobium sp. Gha TaxID=1855318 RepID=UPI0008EB8132|nr:IS110 family transposase [Bradyrhizobium sp. Gha]SFJ35155.1 transposase [Bradyrhizobium sp. Gha]